MNKIKVRSYCELDKLVAEKIFDWCDFWQGDGYLMGYPPDEQAAGIEGERAEVWDYSTDMNAAWAIVQEFDNPHTSVVIETYSKGWSCRIVKSNPEIFQGLAPTAPIAICLAALKTRGVEVEFVEARQV